ncbi:MAG: RnfABCDGE type electron transport complex subunit D [Lachnospiraceae bacterium]
MSELLHVSSAPHVRHKDTVHSIMRDVLIGLLPATLAGIYNFGLDAVLVIITAVASCVALEAMYQFFMHKKVCVADLSAAVTGLLLALNLPSTLPLGMVIIGSFFAIIVVKQLFGGLGQNFMNPALGARCFLLISFAGRMTNFVYDGVTGATPLALVKAGENVDVWRMFLGTTAGTIGETSTLAILIGAAYLLLRKVIKITIPACYIGSFTVFVLIFGGHGLDLTYLAAHLCGGGLMLGAFFMATDYVTSPATPKGKVVFGILLGILTGLFRLFGNSAEGVSYAIIFGNLLVPIIEKYTYPTPFGRGKEAAK